MLLRKQDLECEQSGVWKVLRQNGTRTRLWDKKVRGISHLHGLLDEKRFQYKLDVDVDFGNNGNPLTSYGPEQASHQTLLQWGATVILSLKKGRITIRQTDGNLCNTEGKMKERACICNNTFQE